MNSPGVAYYFERFGFCPAQILEPPHPALGIVVVIPAYNEPKLLPTLEALWTCARPSTAVEVIVVINSEENAPPTVLKQNEKSFREAAFWSREDCDRYFRIHLLQFPALPKKHAGVGLARKIGMDEALRRLDAVNRLNGVIGCLDADSTCDPNYLVELDRFFEAHPRSPGCSIYFEHPLEGNDPPQIDEAITLYELHLRYYIEGLRLASFPHAFHTIGSSIAVRAEPYMKQGGMNRRRAGEDFYFLHKIIPLGHFGEVNSTRVIPSPRPSDRVPFGTGRAVRDYLADGRLDSYPLEAFRDLKRLFAPVIRGEIPALSDLPAPLQAFLDTQNFHQAIEEIRKNTASAAAFTNRFFRWFDGFLAMKYIHYARDAAYGPGDVVASVRELLETAQSDPRELLVRLRAIQRSANSFKTD